MTQREEFEKWLNTLDKQTLVTMAAKQARTIEELQAAMKAAVPQWIPVGERLPDFDGGPYVSKPVLAFDKYDDVVFARYVKSGYWVILYIDERREHGEITHWMPLPAAPDGEK